MTLETERIVIHEVGSALIVSVTVRNESMSEFAEIEGEGDNLSDALFDLAYQLRGIGI